MDMFIVEGGRPLAGDVCVAGSKNAALPIMAAALALDGPSTLRNVPQLVDVETLGQVLTTLGANVTRPQPGTVVIDPEDHRPCVADYELVRRMRASVCVLGPLLGRRGEACVSLPGGCNIGHRPIDLHLKGLRALGAEISIDRGYVRAKARRLVGAEVYLGGPCGSTVTGTCNVMTAACFAEGKTTISAAACEPEVEDLGRFLNAAGAKISGLGTPLLQIEGGERLYGVEHQMIPDRIEAATLMLAAAITRGQLSIHGVRTDHLAAVIDALKSIGVPLVCHGSTVQIFPAERIRPCDLTALPYPGFPTDVQAQMMALLSLADGISVVTDKVFPDRFMHIPELCRMGAQIRREAGSGIVNGVAQLSGACVMASDLRASAALLLAALAAEGESVIRRIYHLDRGYERLEIKLQDLGAHVRRVPDEPGWLPSGLRPQSAELDSASRSSTWQAVVPPPRFLKAAAGATITARQEMVAAPAWPEGTALESATAPVAGAAIVEGLTVGASASMAEVGGERTTSIETGPFRLVSGSRPDLADETSEETSCPPGN
jgi:UDP-N-acetylglucosamine 1-carboxyvinyltransferase